MDIFKSTHLTMTRQVTRGSLQGRRKPGWLLVRITCSQRPPAQLRSGNHFQNVTVSWSTLQLSYYLQKQPSVSLTVYTAKKPGQVLRRSDFLQGPQMSASPLVFSFKLWHTRATPPSYLCSSASSGCSLHVNFAVSLVFPQLLAARPS